MRIGIISDIHGNLDALKTVIKKADQLGITKFIVAGDLVGYYYNVKEVLKMLASRDCIYVKGNHEILLEQCLNDSKKLEYVTDKYGSSIKQSIKTLSKDEIDFLISLPENHSLIIDKLSFFICHGSTESPFDYVYPDADKKTIYKKLISDAEVTIFGNTHYQTIFNYNHKILINPGSVGQPRNNQTGAHWAIFDTNTKITEHRVEKYDPSKLIDQINFYDPHNAYLKKQFRYD